MGEMDADGSGEVDQAEFTRWWRRVRDGGSTTLGALLSDPLMMSDTYLRFQARPEPT